MRGLGKHAQDPAAMRGGRQRSDGDQQGRKVGEIHAYTHHRDNINQSPSGNYKAKQWNIESPGVLRRRMDNKVYEDHRIFSNEWLNGNQKHSSCQQLEPIRNMYNIINSEQLPKYYLQNRKLSIEKSKSGKHIPSVSNRDYNIVTGSPIPEQQDSYLKRQQRLVNHKMDQYSLVHNYNNIFSRFYDTFKERQHIQSQNQQVLNNAQLLIQNPTPSYKKNASTISLDPQKDLPSKESEIQRRKLLSLQRRRKLQIQERQKAIQKQIEKQRKLQEKRKQKYINSKIREPFREQNQFLQNVENYLIVNKEQNANEIKNTKKSTMIHFYYIIQNIQLFLLEEVTMTNQNQQEYNTMTSASFNKQQNCEHQPQKTFGKTTQQNSPWNISSSKYLKKYKKFNNENDILTYNNIATQHIEVQSKKSRIPLRNLYNIISNQKLPQFCLKDRIYLLPVFHKRKPLFSEKKGFNIITGLPLKQSNFQLKSQNQQNKIIKNVFQNQKYNPIFNRYYSDIKEEEYQKTEKNKQKQHGKKYNERFPPCYKSRQPFLINQNQIPQQNLIKINNKKQNSLKRYKVKYQFEEKYGIKNQQHEAGKQKINYNNFFPAKLSQLTDKNQQNTQLKNNIIQSNTKIVNNKLEFLIRTNGFKNY